MKGCIFYLCLHRLCLGCYNLLPNVLGHLSTSSGLDHSLWLIECKASSIIWTSIFLSLNNLSNGKISSHYFSFFISVHVCNYLAHFKLNNIIEFTLNFICYFFYKFTRRKRILKPWYIGENSNNNRLHLAQVTWTKTEKAKNILVLVRWLVVGYKNNFIHSLYSQILQGYWL